MKLLIKMSYSRDYSYFTLYISLHIYGCKILFINVPSICFHESMKSPLSGPGGEINLMKINTT